MFNIGFSEFIVIGALALIFIGPKQLPEVARAVGKFLNELRRASDEAMSIFKESHSKSQNFLRNTQDEINKAISLDKVEKLVDMPKDILSKDEKPKA